jgi:hypothetical protein
MDKYELAAKIFISIFAFGFFILYGIPSIYVIASVIYMIYFGGGI